MKKRRGRNNTAYQIDLFTGLTYPEMIKLRLQESIIRSSREKKEIPDIPNINEALKIIEK